MTAHAGNFFTGSIGRQTAKGTAQTTPKFKLRATDWAIVPDPQVIDLPETDSSIQESRGVKVGQLIGGAGQGFVRSDEFGFLAYGALGSLGTAGIGPYTHTITPFGETPYLTLYPAYDSTALVDRYADFRVGEFVWRGGAVQALTYECAGLGITATHGQTDPASPAPSAVEPLVYPNVTVTLGGVTTDIIESFELRSTRVLQAIQGDTGMAPSDIANGRWGASGTLTVLFETDAKWRAWLTNSPTGTVTSQQLFTEALTITATRSASDEIVAALAAVELRRVVLQPDASGNPLRFTYEFKAQPQTVLGNTLTYTVKNSIATY